MPTVRGARDWATRPSRATVSARTYARVVRYALGIVLSVVALNALFGGLYGLLGAAGVPREWLEGSPFRDYFVPSLFLLVVVGGSFSAAAFAVWTRNRYARPLAYFAGGIAVAWILVQIVVIGSVSWLQPAVATAGIIVVVLAWLLPSGMEDEG